MSNLNNIKDYSIPVADVTARVSLARIFLIIMGVLLLAVLILYSAFRIFGTSKMEAETVDASRLSVFGENSMKFPGGLFFDKSHTWIFMEKNGQVRIGIDDFLQHVTGPITRVKLKKPGDRIVKGEAFMSLIQRGKQLEIQSPVSGIIREQLPMLYPDYKHQVRRVMPDGSFESVNHDSELDIIFHPTVLQISRWDRLKGFKELMEAFILMKKENEKKTDKKSLAYRRIRHTRLALGGPDPAFVSDDPEGMEVFFYNDSAEIESEIRADYTIYYAQDKLWHATGNVIARRLDKGDAIYTEELFWDMENEEIYSNSYTRVHNEDNILYGKRGFKSHQDLSNWQLIGSSGTINVQDEE